MQWQSYDPGMALTEDVTRLCCPWEWKTWWLKSALLRPRQFLRELMPLKSTFALILCKIKQHFGRNWPEIIANVGQLLQIWASAASRDQPRACSLLFFHSVQSSGLDDFIGFYEKKGTPKFLIHFHLLSSTIVTRGNQLPQIFLLPGIPSTLI